MNFADFIAKLEGVTTNGDSAMARCPSHDDKRPSLSINEGADGRILIHCHAGCPTESVLRTLGMSFKDLFPKRR